MVPQSLKIRNLIPAIDGYEAEQVMYISTAKMDPTIPFISTTASRIGSTDLDPIRCDAINKYIMGNIDRAAYQTAQQQWLSAGGSQVIREYEEQVRANF